MTEAEKGQENSSPGKKRVLAVILVLFLIVLFTASLFGDKGLIEVYRARLVYTEIQNEITLLKQENEKLTREINELSNSSGIIEKIAREDLNMAKPGEEVYIFLE